MASILQSPDNIDNKSSSKIIMGTQFYTAQIIGLTAVAFHSGKIFGKLDGVWHPY